MRDPFGYFNSSPEVIRIAVMMYIRYPLSLRQVEDILFERGIDICRETVRFWCNLFGPMFAAAISSQGTKTRVASMVLKGEALPETCPMIRSNCQFSIVSNQVHRSLTITAIGANRDEFVTFEEYLRFLRIVTQ